MRYIDADALKKSVEGLTDCYNGFSDTYDKACIIGLIDEEPTVDAVKVKHGHWEIAIGYDPKKSFQCSECRLMAYEPTKYCPHCGSRMDEVTE